MTYFNPSPLAGSARIQAILNQPPPGSRAEKFGYRESPSIITTNESLDRNTDSFSHRHSPHAIDYSDPFTHLPEWRKQVMLPFPPPSGYIERNTYGPSRFESQTTRIQLHHARQAEEIQQRSQRFLQAQEAQRLERAREDASKKQGKIEGAMSKAGVGLALTLEERFVLSQQAYETEKRQSEKQTRGLAGTEHEMQNTARAAQAAAEARAERRAAEAAAAARLQWS
ncbi:MAG: hypothetical protein Q9196_004529 [Gyalolechia fulgens]